MESAYVQARVWEPDRVWRRGNAYITEGVYSKGIGVYLCLLEYYFKINALSELLDTIWFLANFLSRIDDKEKVSLAKISSYVIQELLDSDLLENDFKKGDLRIKMIAILPLTIIKEFSNTNQSADLLIAMRCLSSAMEENLTVENCEANLALYSEIANNMTLKFQNDKHVEQMQAAQKAAFIAGRTTLEKRLFSDETLPSEDVSEHSPILRQATEIVIAKVQEVAEPTVESKFHDVFHRLSTLIKPPVVEGTKERERPETEYSQDSICNILRSVGSVKEKSNLLALLKSLEKEAVSKKDKHGDLDLCLALTLWRLIDLWSDGGALVEGRAHLENLLEKLKREKSSPKDFVKQLKSAIEFSSTLLDGDWAVEKTIGAAHHQALEETSECVAILSLLALHFMHNRDEQSVELIQTVMLNLYSDTTGDVARRVGEMFWLLQETSLRANKASLFSLVKLCQRKANDEYLKFRMEFHLNRMALLIEEPMYLQYLISWALVAGSANNSHEYLRWEVTNRLLSLLTMKRDFTEEADAERIRYEERDKVDLKTKSSSILKKMEQHAEKKEWMKFATGFVSNHSSIEVDKSVFRLLNIALAAIRDDELLHAQALLDLVHPALIDLNIYAYNAVVDKLAVAWTLKNERKRAIKLLQTASAVVFQTEETESIFAVKLAELFVADGNLFGAVVLLYEAYFGVPDSQDLKSDDALAKFN